MTRTFVPPVGHEEELDRRAHQLDDEVTEGAKGIYYLYPGRWEGMKRDAEHELLIKALERIDALEVRVRELEKT